MLILLIVLLLLFGGGGGYYGYSQSCRNRRRGKGKFEEIGLKSAGGAWA
jgi:hypothetical protein